MNKVLWQDIWVHHLQDTNQTEWIIICLICASLIFTGLLSELKDIAHNNLASPPRIGIEGKFQAYE